MFFFFFCGADSIRQLGFGLCTHLKAELIVFWQGRVEKVPGIKLEWIFFFFFFFFWFAVEFYNSSRVLWTQVEMAGSGAGYTDENFVDAWLWKAGWNDTFILNYLANQQQISWHLCSVFVPPEYASLYFFFIPLSQFSASVSPLFFTPISQDLSAHNASFAHQHSLKLLEMLF